MKNTKVRAYHGSTQDGRQLDAPHAMMSDEEFKAASIHRHLRTGAPIMGLDKIHRTDAVEEAVRALGGVKCISATVTRAPYSRYGDDPAAHEYIERAKRDQAARLFVEEFEKLGLVNWRPDSDGDGMRMRREKHEKEAGKLDNTARYGFDFDDITERAELVVMTRADYKKLAAALARLQDLEREIDHDEEGRRKTGYASEPGWRTPNW